MNSVKSLVKSLKKNDIADVRKAIEAGQWSTDDISATIHYVVSHDDNKSIEVLLAATGVDPIGPDGHPTSSPLAVAALAGNLTLVNRLLADGADPNGAVMGYGFTGERSKTTGLVLAAQRNQEAVAIALISAGSDPNARFELMEAQRRNAPALVAALNSAIILKALLEAGADPNGLVLMDQDSERSEPVLAWAAQFGLPDSIRILLEAGADPNWRDSKHSVLGYSFYGENAESMKAIVSAARPAETSGHDFLVMMVRDSVRPKSVRTPMRLSIYTDNSLPVPPTVDENTLTSPLMFATMIGDTGAVERLLAAGCDPGHRDCYGREAADSAFVDVSQSDFNEIRTMGAQFRGGQQECQRLIREAIAGS